ncbi:MAG TPA: hypothetical protein VHF25_08240 [Nitriliruptorales bacterium]|nr:hypothetical protein [Nitriliruptorales bacterium]
MSRALHVFHPVDAPPNGLALAFDSDPGGWLPAVRRLGPSAWRVELRFRGLSRPVRCEVGDAWIIGDTTWRTLRWVPLSDPNEGLPLERVLPTFSGELGLHHADTATLVLTGTYDVPLAAAGELADAALLNRVARHTGDSFLREVARRLVEVTRSLQGVPATT